jgi:hypothetical protein
MHRVGLRLWPQLRELSQEITWFQTALAKGQHKQRCRPVSKGPLQNTQCSWCGNPLFCRLCAVRILSCTRIQAKILHLFSTCALQIRLFRNRPKEPLNWIWYAERVEYTPSGVHLHAMESRTPCWRCMSWILTHREMNSSMWTVEVILPLRERIQLLFCSSCCTVLFFLRASWNKFGATYLGASPSSQLWCQKRAFAPSPHVIVIDELKRRRSTSLQGSSDPSQGFDSSTHSCHSQRRRRALPNLSRSGTPRPPGSLGLVTVGQLTKQCPPLAFSSPSTRTISYFYQFSSLPKRPKETLWGVQATKSWMHPNRP